MDAFIAFSLSVQNRRKARMGHSLENHLEAVFRALRVRYVRGAVTENNQRPDFLFPSVEAYRRAPATGAPCLAMLGAKSTCKDRWRQVLAEASKIPDKHLLTLEPGISEQQTRPDDPFTPAARRAAGDPGNLYRRTACVAPDTGRLHPGRWASRVCMNRNPLYECPHALHGLGFTLTSAATRNTMTWEVWFCVARDGLAP